MLGIRSFLPLIALTLPMACNSNVNPATASGGSGNASGGSTATSSSTASGSSTSTSSSTASGGTTSVSPCSAEATSSGEATYYDFADGSGACSFDPTPNDLMVGAMNAPDYGNSEPCGACARIVGPNGTITVRIVDLCPECPKGNIDLSPVAFEKIAPRAQGRVPITWQYVPCSVTGSVIYHFKDGSNQWWTAVQLRNHRHAIARFEYQKAGTFVEVPRVDYNFFVAASGMGPGPYTFRVTDVNGATIIDSAIQLGDNADRAGTQQFPPCN